MQLQRRKPVLLHGRARLPIGSGVDPILAVLLMLAVVLASFTAALFRSDFALGGQGSLDEFPSSIAGGAGGAPIDFATGHDGQMWATETGGEIVRFMPTGGVTGEFAAATGPDPSQPETSQPHGIVVAADGDVWFTDAGTNAEGYAFIGRISPNYHVTEFKLHTPSVVPESIAEGSDGNLWFTESAPQEPAMGAIGRITLGGEITEFTVPAGRESPVAFRSSPTAITLGADGNMWFTDDGWFAFDYRGLVGRITTSGVIDEWPVAVKWGFPIAIAQGADGNVWVTESEGHILRVTPQGEITPFPITTAGGSINSLAEGPDGNLWFAEDDRANAIVRITPAGALTEFSPVAPRGGFPFALGFDNGGHLWFGDAKSSEVWRWNTPRVPLDELPPEVLGDATEGETVTASHGEWAFEPDSFWMQWQSCSPTGDHCVDLPGETSTSHFVTQDDVGHALRVRVTAIGLGGSASVTSAFVGPAGALPMTIASTTPPQSTTPMHQNAPSQAVISATMTWRFAWSHAYTVVRALAIHSLAPGDLVEVACRGHGCPARQFRFIISTRDSCHRSKCENPGLLGPGGQLALRRLFDQRHLRVGATVSLTIRRNGWIGKSFTFVVRSAHAPRVTVSCLTSSSQSTDNSC